MKVGNLFCLVIIAFADTPGIFKDASHNWCSSCNHHHHHSGIHCQGDKTLNAFNCMRPSSSPAPSTLSSPGCCIYAHYYNLACSMSCDSEVVVFGLGSWTVLL